MSAVYTTDVPALVQQAADEIADEVLARIERMRVTREMRQQVSDAVQQVAAQTAAYDAAERAGVRPLYRPIPADQEPSRIDSSAVRAAILALVAARLTDQRGPLMRAMHARSVGGLSGSAWVYQVASATGEPFTTVQRRWLHAGQ